MVNLSVDFVVIFLILFIYYLDDTQLDCVVIEPETKPFKKSDADCFIEMARERFICS